MLSKFCLAKSFSLAGIQYTTIAGEVRNLIINGDQPIGYYNLLTDIGLGLSKQRLCRMSQRRIIHNSPRNPKGA